MNPRTHLAALAVAVGSAACSTLGTTPQRDFNSLSERETAEFTACAAEGMSIMPAERVVRGLSEAARENPSLALLLRDPHVRAPLLLAHGLSLAYGDCAEKMKIDPETVPPVTLSITINEGSAPQRPQQRENRNNRLDMI